MSEKLCFDRKSKPSTDREIQAVADNVLAALKDLKSPKDAATAFVLAHFKMIAAAFPPSSLNEALEAVQAHNKAVIDAMEDGWK